jgi:preprotein translocase subunit SecD
MSKGWLVCFSLLCCLPARAEEPKKRVAWRVEPSAVFRAAEVVRARLVALGITPDIVAGSSGRIVVALPANRAAELRAVVERPGRLEFFVVAMPAESVEGGPGRETEERRKREAQGEGYSGPPTGFRWAPLRLAPGQDRLVEVPVAGAFTGADLDPAGIRVRSGDFGVGYVIDFAIRAGRAADFGDFTERIVKRQMAILIDGAVEVAPMVQERLPSGGHISGGGMDGFTKQEALHLAAVLTGGELPCVLTPID